MPHGWMEPWNERAVMSVKSMIAAVCAMLACGQFTAASGAEGDLNKQLPAGSATVPALCTAPENSSMADLTSQTIIPCTFTLVAENPGLAARAPGSADPATWTAPSDRAIPATAASTTTSAESKSAQTCDKCNDTCGECFACCKCGPPGDYWLRDEYVGWWAHGGLLPTLVATSPTGTLPATVPLYGNGTYNNDYRSGNWTQGGMWFDCCHT